MAPIPVEVEDLTAEWLTTVLAAVAPGATIDAVEILDQHSGTTGRVRLRLECDDDRIPASVFVKIAPFTPARRAMVDMVGMGVSEARFYAEVSSGLPVRTPTVWHAEYDEAGRYIMVLEDLTASGATQPTQDEPDSEAFAGQVMDVFASFHAELHGSSRLGPGGDLGWIGARGRGYGGGAAAGIIKHAVDTLGADMPPVFHELAELYLPNADRVAALLAEGAPTLIHGDSHIGNFLRQDGAPVLLDWAMVSSGPGIRDIAYYVGNSVPTEVRRNNEQDLVRRYLDALAGHGVDLPFDETWDRYRLHMVTGWISAVATAGMGDALQPLEIGLLATARSNTTIGDLDVVPLLRAALD
jgi:hypothetical protein